MERNISFVKETYVSNQKLVNVKLITTINICGLLVSSSLYFINVYRDDGTKNSQILIVAKSFFPVEKNSQSKLFQ